MKLKSILSISSVFVLLAILVSSCGSTLNITKKRHSNGYYVNIGHDSHDTTNKSSQKKNKRSDLAKLINEKSNNSDMASNVEGSDDANGENSENNNESNTNKLSTEQLAAAEEFSKMSTLKKIKALKNAKKRSQLEENSEVTFLLLILLAILLPPVAVFLKRGISTSFWISLILTLLFWIPGVIYALLIVFDAI